MARNPDLARINLIKALHNGIKHMTKLFELSHIWLLEV